VWTDLFNEPFPASEYDFFGNVDRKSDCPKVGYRFFRRGPIFYTRILREDHEKSSTSVWTFPLNFISFLCGPFFDTRETPEGSYLCVRSVTRNRLFSGKGDCDSSHNRSVRSLLATESVRVASEPLCANKFY